MVKTRKKTRIKSVDVDDPMQYPVKCPGCRKSVRSCICYEYRLQGIDGTVGVYVDQVATDPVRGEMTGTWQARRNAKIYRRPLFLDGFGPIMYVTDEAMLEEVNAAINDKTFFLFDYVEREGCRVRNFERNLIRRLPFLKRKRTRQMDNNSDSGSAERQAA